MLSLLTAGMAWSKDIAICGESDGYSRRHQDLEAYLAELVRPKPWVAEAIKGYFQ
jgi:hypothetical protein